LEFVFLLLLLLFFFFFFILSCQCSYRWCICDMLEARCAYCASSIRLRTATAGGGRSVDVRAPPAARPPAGVRERPEAFFSGGRSGGTGGCCCWESDGPVLRRVGRAERGGEGGEKKRERKREHGNQPSHALSVFPHEGGQTNSARGC